MKSTGKESISVTVAAKKDAVLLSASQDELASYRDTRVNEKTLD